ncbi:MAG: serine protease [Pseudomonadota bacterium]
MIAANPAPPVTRHGKLLHRVTAPHKAEGGPWKLWLQASNAQEPIVLREINSDDYLAKISVADAKRGVWSPPLTTSLVYMAVPQQTDLRIRLLSWEEFSVNTQTPVGTLNLKEVKVDTLPLRLQQHIPGVGLLQLLSSALPDADTSEEQAYVYCTAFMVSSHHAVTAHHCVDIGLENRFAKMTLGFASAAGRATRTSAHQVALFAQSEALDVAVLTVDPAASEKAEFSLAGADPEPGTPALVMQHFSANPLSISDDVDCQIGTPRFDGPSFWDHDNDTEGQPIEDALLAHGCDTTHSSSGSPILDRASYKLVGMHLQGYLEDGEAYNRGLAVGLLRQFLVEHGVLSQPELYVTTDTPSHEDTSHD